MSVTALATVLECYLLPNRLRYGNTNGTMLSQMHAKRLITYLAWINKPKIEMCISRRWLATSKLSLETKVR